MGTSAGQEQEVHWLGEKLEQTGGIDGKRAVNGAPGSPRTVCHAVITRNTARRVGPEAGERRGERVRQSTK